MLRVRERVLLREREGEQPLAKQPKLRLNRGAKRERQHELTVPNQPLLLQVGAINSVDSTLLATDNHGWSLGVGTFKLKVEAERL